MQTIIDFLLQRPWEIAGVVCGLLYLILIIRENTWCWPFGIAGSAITVGIFFQAGLYLEAGLNVYYVLAGVYGWYFWQAHKRKGEGSPPVTEWTGRHHLVNILLCIALTLGVGRLMHTYTDSPRPYIDAAMTIFGISATVLEARKVLSAWIYWFFINGFSIWLQYDRQIYFYAALSVYYTIMSIRGYTVWRKSYINKEGVII